MIDFKSNLGVVGATGAVGQVLLSILEERKIPFQKIKFFASPQSEGKKIKIHNQEVPCEVLKEGCFQGLDIVFFDISDELSKTWVPQAAQEGAFVVDNSAAFRMEKETLLCIPEINGAAVIERVKNKKSLRWQERIFSCPNCSTAQLVLSLFPLHQKWNLNRVIVSTYQSVSGAGYKAIEELKNETLHFLNKEEVQTKEFQYPMPFNCIPQIGSFQTDDYSSEELKMIHETKKILDLPHLKITTTAVRVPTLSCHSESVYVELQNKFQLNEIRDAFENQDGVALLDDCIQKKYPMPINATGRDEVFVGRIRKGLTEENALQFWIVSDNLRKGAALNAVQIGEKILEGLS